MLARHVPGLGGVAVYNALTMEEAHGMLQHLSDDLRREAAAYRRRK